MRQPMTPPPEPSRDGDQPTDDSGARERLVMSLMGLVRRLCQRFSYSRDSLEDLVQVGSVGLIKAIDKFDPNRGTPLAAFAVPVILGEIKNYFRDHGWAIKVPRKLLRQRLLVQRATITLTQELSRWPTIPEIAQATGLSLEAVDETLELTQTVRPMSIDEPLSPDGEEDETYLRDSLGSDDPHFDALVTRLTVQGALEHLPKLERTIVVLRFYRGLTQSQVAERLGVSQTHVSRLERRAIAKLRNYLTSDVSSPSPGQATRPTGWTTDGKLVVSGIPRLVESGTSSRRS